MALLRRLYGVLGAPGHVTFCDSCGQVCDTTCRANAQRQRTLSQVQNSLPMRL